MNKTLEDRVRGRVEHGSHPGVKTALTKTEEDVTNGHITSVFLAKTMFPKSMCVSNVLIPCSCGNFYLGETVRRLETRLKEHIDACEKGMWEKSAIAEHAWVEGHRILWEEASIVDRARSQTELLMKEALHIRSETPNDILNRDGGLDIHGCWVETIKTLKQRQETESAQAIYTNSL